MIMFNSLLVIGGVAIAVPLLLGLVPAVKVPAVVLEIFLAALLVVRGPPALLYVRAIGRAHALAAGFMQATSLTFIVVATVIGVETNHQRTSTATALVVAGLLSVVIYPPIASHC